MSIKSTIRAFREHCGEFSKLPFSHRLHQLPPCVLSYFDSPVARRLGSIPPIREFRFSLNSEIRISFRPEHFGMVKGVLADGEYFHLPCGVPRNILDLGSNIGLSMIVFHDLYPSAEIAGVDADPRNFELLLHNLKTNDVDAEVMVAAISGSTGFIDLRIGSNSACSTMISGDLIHPMHTASVAVPVINMPELLHHLGWKKVDLLKVDIEGAEDSLFDGSPAWLDHIGMIVLEIHPNTSPDRIAAMLAPRGFTLHRHGQGREPVYVAKRSA